MIRLLIVFAVGIAVRQNPHLRNYDGPHDHSEQGKSMTRLVLGSNKDEPEKEGAKKGCDPPCEENHGICMRNTCFCRHPFYGETCKQKVKTEMRLSYSVAVALGCAAVIIGALVGGVLSKCLATYRDHRALTALLGEGSKLGLRRETWKKGTSPDDT